MSIFKKKYYFYTNKVEPFLKTAEVFKNYFLNATHETRALCVDHVQSTASKTIQTQDHNLNS